MIDLFRRLYGHSFQRRLALCLSCICVASVLLVGVCSYRLASRELRVLSSKLSERNIASAGQALDDYLLSVQDWTTQMLRIAPLRKAPDNPAVPTQSLSAARSPGRSATTSAAPFQTASASLWSSCT